MLRDAVECEGEYRSAAKLHRFTLAFTVDANAFGASGASRDVEAVMRSRGFAYPQSANSGPAADAFPKRQLPRGSVSAGLRYRMDRAWSSELQMTVGLRESVAGFDSVSSRYVEMSSSPVRVATLAQYQRGPVRLGLGPALLIGNWTTSEDARTLGSLGVPVGGLLPGGAQHVSVGLSLAMGWQ